MYNLTTSFLLIGGLAVGHWFDLEPLVGIVIGVSIAVVFWHFAVKKLIGAKSDKKT